MPEEFSPPNVDLPEYLKNPLDLSIHEHINYNHHLYDIEKIFGEVLYGLKRGLIMGSYYHDTDYNTYSKEIYKRISESYTLYNQVREYINFRIWDALKKGKPS